MGKTDKPPSKPKKATAKAKTTAKAKATTSSGKASLSKKAGKTVKAGMEKITETGSKFNFKFNLDIDFNQK
jgi:hypothetical protein